MAKPRQIKYHYEGKFNPEKLGSDNIDRLSMAMVPDKSKVLELGAATGFMGKYLAQAKRCQVTGVDLNPATKPDIVGDLDQELTWKKITKKGKFDVVLASAILEHLKDPERALERIKGVLKPEGVLVVTLPNIAHWRMRLNLLVGRWNYEDYGILDRTHLRFFNYFTALKLVRRAGFKIIEVAIDPAGGLKYFNWLVKSWPNLYAHQIAIKAVKN